MLTSFGLALGSAFVHDDREDSPYCDVGFIAVTPPTTQFRRAGQRGLRLTERFAEV
jgi:hypothetical protein